jgi:hypothetical protein
MGRCPTKPVTDRFTHGRYRPRVTCMGTGATDTEPFLVTAGVRMADCDSDRAVVLQPLVPELENHVGVRHASALHAAGYAAGLALVEAAVAELDGSVELRLQGSEIAYKAMGLGELETVAEPSAGGWETQLEQLRAGSSVELACTATTTNAEGKAVAELTLSWIATPAPR